MHDRGVSDSESGRGPAPKRSDQGDLARTAPVFDIERYATHDGPGIRTTVFLKGCPLRCLWCHNPEAMSPRPELLFTGEKCLVCEACAEVCPQGVHSFADGEHRLDRSACEACGRCVAECYAGALEMAGRHMSVAEVLTEVLRDRVVYDRSGGGVTISGGEPLSHFPFTRALVRSARGEGLHLAVDTSGYCPWSFLEELASEADLILYDLKQMDPDRHRALTGVDNERILTNLRQLDTCGVPIWIRLPLIPGCNDEVANYEAVGRFLASLKHVQRIEMLRYHRLAESKYERLGQPYALPGLPTPDEELAESRKRILESFGLTNVVWR